MPGFFIFHAGVPLDFPIRPAKKSAFSFHSIEPFIFAFVSRKVDRQTTSQTFKNMKESLF
ncbi:hypothetical protein DET65_2381 [Sunxiuqinia elliptica]|uniref:Uncharacterized protein n=1 Tax=Sunxiuqinia elliptica TaxID=655355 RepID=A0A4R6GQ01_9BACT|nr:hypothetical protein DET52_110164 [Sunxiuqinia elliptica]TDO60570.1 hypothetical protein DET65_2381 [Sunxiuqinia elliptica]